jgi:hypothetical protein
VIPILDVKENTSMSAEASRCFTEAKSNLESASAALSNEPVDPGPAFPYKDFHTAHTLAIMAVIAAKGGSFPGQKHKLVSVCESIGLWAVMPPKLREHLIAIDCLGSDSGEPSVESRRESLSPDAWKERLQTAPKFLFFLENHVAANPQILRALTVS